MQLAAGSARRQKSFQRFRKQTERRLVALVNHQVGKRGGDFRRQHVFRLAVRAGVIHRGARVHKQVNHHVGLRLVLADEQPSRPAIRPPVNAFRVVAGNVFLVIAELDRRTAIRRPVFAGKETFDSGTREQKQIAKPFQFRRRKQQTPPDHRLVPLEKSRQWRRSDHLSRGNHRRHAARRRHRRGCRGHFHGPQPCFDSIWNWIAHGR